MSRQVTDFSARRALRAGGASRQQIRRWLAIILFGVLTIAGFVAAQNVVDALGLDFDAELKIFSAVVSVLAISIALIQWNSIRRENTYDKYYDRMKIVNDAINAFRCEQLEPGSDEIYSHRRTMLVFAELDNLEYVLGKYYYGYADFTIVERGIMTFRSWCKYDEFCTEVLEWISEPPRAMGYRPQTRRVARYIVAHAREHEPARMDLGDRGR